MLASILLAAAVSGLVQPTGPWRLDYEPDQCVLSRMYGNRLMGLRWFPLSAGYSLFEVDPAVTDATTGRSRGYARIGGGEAEAVVIETVDVPGCGRMTRVGVTGDPLVALETVKTIEPVAAPGRVGYAIVKGATAARALRRCQDVWLRQKGIDPADVARIGTPAVPIDPADWLKADDYPAHAIRAEHEGRSVILWTVTATGAIQNCRAASTSGFAELDQAACAAVTMRGRYASPALDRDGKAIASYAVRTVNWVMPKM